MYFPARVICHEICYVTKSWHAYGSRRLDSVLYCRQKVAENYGTTVQHERSRESHSSELSSSISAQKHNCREHILPRVAPPNVVEIGATRRASAWEASRQAGPEERVLLFDQP